MLKIFSKARTIYACTCILFQAPPSLFAYSPSIFSSYPSSVSLTSSSVSFPALLCSVCSTSPCFAVSTAEAVASLPTWNAFVELVGFVALDVKAEVEVLFMELEGTEGWAMVSFAFERYCLVLELLLLLL